MNDICGIEYVGVGPAPDCRPISVGLKSYAIVCRPFGTWQLQLAMMSPEGTAYNSMGVSTLWRRNRVLTRW